MRRSWEQCQAVPGRATVVGRSLGPENSYDSMLAGLISSVPRRRVGGDNLPEVCGYGTYSLHQLAPVPQLYMN